MLHVDFSMSRPLSRAATLLVVVLASSAAYAQRQSPANRAAPPPASSTTTPSTAAPNGDATIQVLLDRIDELERRLSQLESTAVISQPKVLVKEVHVWIDDDGNQYDHEVPGSKEVITYERELAQRRETIEDSIGEALEAEAAGRV